MCEWTYFFFVLHIQRHDIQNQKQIRTLACSEPEAYSLVHLDPWQTSTMERFAKIVVGSNYFRNISFSCYYEFFQYMSNFYSKSISNVILIPLPHSLLKNFWCALLQTQHYANVLGNESINFFQQKVTKVRQTVLYRISFLSFSLMVCKLYKPGI